MKKLLTILMILILTTPVFARGPRATIFRGTIVAINPWPGQAKWVVDIEDNRSKRIWVFAVANLLCPNIGAQVRVWIQENDEPIIMCLKE